MHRKASILLAALLVLSVIAVIPASGSLGNILVGVKVAPSPATTIKLGQNVSLWFGAVTWSGGMINLYLSTNGYAALNYTTDVAYGPTFKVSDLKASVNKQVVSGDLRYTIGYNWINGTVPTALNVPGGDYYIKAFDGITSAVAVTDNYITIQASFEVVPSSGPGQASIELRAYALPANDYANFSYNAGAGWVVIINLKKADAKGKVVHAMLAPDLKEALPAGEGLEDWTDITFRMIVNSTIQTETDIFSEYMRGLKQVKGYTAELAAAGNLFGNNTDFGVTPTGGVSTVDVKVLGSVILAGNHFHPGPVTILWDKTISIGTATVNGTGWFNTTVTVPITSKGDHNITIDEAKTRFVIWVNVIPTLVLVPDEGPVGTSVTAYGYGFVASTATVKYNATLWWDFVNACDPEPLNLTKVRVGTNGQFTGSFVVPHTVGGDHDVNATEDDGPPRTGAIATFTVTSTLVVSPSTFYNNGTMVTLNGTGLAYQKVYDLNLDNHKDFLVLGDCVGDFTLKFVAAAGFQPGVHVATMYTVTNSSGLNPVYESHVLFTVNSLERDVLLDKLDEALDKLDDIDGSLADLSDFVESDSESLHGDISDAQEALLEAIETARGDISGLATTLASIETLAQNAASKATEAATSAGNAAQSSAAAELAAEAAQSTTSGISTAVYGAIVLSLIAALASIFAVITLQKKVAG